MAFRYEKKRAALLNFDEAKNRIVALLRKQHPDDTEALATHWLQNPGLYSFHLTRRLHEECLHALGKEETHPTTQQK